MPRTPAAELRDLAMNLAADPRPASAIVADLIALNDGEYHKGDEQFLIRCINEARH